MRGAKCFAGGALAGLTALGLLYQYVFVRDPGPLAPLLDKKNHLEDYYRHRDGEAERLRQVKNCIRCSISGERGAELRGFYYPCGERPCGRVAFLVHGYRSEHAETAGMYLDFWHSRGFDLFCPDNRACGESGGQLITYDALESLDCLRWLDFLRRELGEDIQIALQGFSLGGATVLKISDRVPENVRFIVSDSGFADARELLKRKLGALYWPLTEIDRILTGFDMSITDVRPNLTRAQTPILFAHGSLDVTVPIDTGRELFRLCPTEKDSLFVEGARHVEVLHCAPEAYGEKIDSFINKYFN